MSGASTKAQAIGAGKLAAVVRAVDADPTKTPTQTVRELRGLSQRELAARSGVSADDIVNLENGVVPHVLLLASVAYALGVPPNLLLGQTLKQDNAR